MKEVDAIFSDYLRVIVAMYEKLRTIYNSFVNKFLTKEQRKQLNLNPENSTIHESANEETKAERFDNSMKMARPKTAIEQSTHRSLSKKMKDGEIKVDIRNI